MESITNLKKSGSDWIYKDKLEGSSRKQYLGSEYFDEKLVVCQFKSQKDIDILIFLY
jgi:hypothetical protein